MARAYQQNTDPEANAWREVVNGEVERGPRENHVSTVAAGKRSREESRSTVIEEWEAENPKEAIKSNKSTVTPSPPGKHTKWDITNIHPQIKNTIVNTY